MKMLCKLVLMSGVAMAAAAFPAMAQQGPGGMMGPGPGGMMGPGPGGMMGPGGPGMMNQGMMGPGTCSMMGGMGPGMMMGWGMMNPAVMGMMMGAPAVQGRLAYVKAELGITDAQASAWDGYASAVNAQVTSMQGMHAGMMQAIQSGSAMDRIDAHIKAMGAMVESLKALKPATEALYAVLTDEQKQKADLLLVTGCMM
jgi:LTXXQ motif family protein